MTRRPSGCLAASRSPGFSLLEVMVAIAILGLALSVILSAQGGLSASNQSAANMGSAIHYGRCKMGELEERMLRMGYPEIDDIQTTQPCCKDDSGNFRCDTRIEKTELPPPPQNSLGDGGLLALSGGGDGGASLGGASGASGLQQLNPAGGASLNLNLDAGLQGLGQQVSSQIGGQGGTAGLFSMAMTFVYPTLKAMMEVSIRRLTVTVRWKEGIKNRELAFVQYVTNPQRAGFLSGVVDPNAAAAGSAAPGTGGAPGAGGAAGGAGRSGTVTGGAAAGGGTK